MNGGERLPILAIRRRCQPPRFIAFELCILFTLASSTDNICLIA
jgi:hypothetical protein